MDDKVEGRGDLGPERDERDSLTAQQGQCLQSVKSIERPVRMDRGETTTMAGVEGLDQIESLIAAYLPHHKPVGPHPKRVANEVADRELTYTLRGGWSSLQPHHVGVRESQLRSILHRDDPSARLYEARHRIEECGLARTSASAHHDVGSGPNCGGDDRSHIRAGERIETELP